MVVQRCTMKYALEYLNVWWKMFCERWSLSCARRFFARQWVASVILATSVRQKGQDWSSFALGQECRLSK